MDTNIEFDENAYFDALVDIGIEEIKAKTGVLISREHYIKIVQHITQTNTKKFIPVQGKLRAELEREGELYIPVRDSMHVNSIRNSLQYYSRHGLAEYKTATGTDENGKDVLHVWLKGGVA